MINIEDCALVIIDIQEKLVKAANKGEKVEENVSKLAKCANILGIETLVTEQYPKGLGNTVEGVKSNLPQEVFIAEKSSFSALLEPEVDNKIKVLKSKGIKQIVICGIETHICLFQTVQMLLNQGFEVFVVKNASSSRSEDEHNAGLELMKQYGAFITTVEIVLFELLKTSKHPKFKEVQALIK